MLETHNRINSVMHSHILDLKYKEEVLKFNKEMITYKIKEIQL